jgi:hypothetical protein
MQMTVSLEDEECDLLRDLENYQINEFLTLLRESGWDDALQFLQDMQDDAPEEQP